MIIPDTSMMPIELRAPAPGPRAKTSGRGPTTVAAAVTRIGRSRVPAARRRLGHRVELGRARLLAMVRELDDQNAVLRHQAHQRDETDLAVDVERSQAEEREEQRSRQSERHGAREDDEGIAEALELRRQ